MDEKDLSKKEFKNYYEDSGKLVYDMNNIETKLRRRNNKKCIECNEEFNQKDIYCKTCGNDLYEVYTDVDKDKNISNNKVFISLKNSKVILTAICAIGILLCMGTVVKFALANELGSFNKFINPIHIILGMNLGTMDIYSSSMYSSGELSFKIGILGFIIWPIVSLIVSNLIFMRKKSKNLNESIMNSVGVGIIYGLILGVLSLISTVRGNTYDLMRYGYSIEYGYRVINLVLNGFVIGFICTFLTNLKKEYDNKYIVALKMAMKTIIIGYILVLIVLTGFNFMNSVYLYQFDISKYSSYTSIGIVLSQLAIYIWSFANLIPVTIGTVNVSLLGLINSSLFTDTKLILLAMIALSALILLLSGTKLSKNEDNKPVLYFSLFYSIIMGLISIVTTIIINGSSSTIAMGSGALVAIIISFIYSYVIAGLGYKLGKVANY